MSESQIKLPELEAGFTINGDTTSQKKNKINPLQIIYLRHINVISTLIDIKHKQYLIHFERLTQIWRT